MFSVRLAGRVSASVIALSLSAAVLAEPAPVIGPAPAWVQESAVPPPNPARKEQPLQILLSSLQQRIGAGQNEVYLRSVSVPQTTAGLQAIGNVLIPWNSERSDLTVHHVKIRRGQQVIDLLQGQSFTILRRENNLEGSTLDGVRTVALMAPGLEIGDQLDIAFTYRTRPGKLATKPESLVAIADSIPYGRMERRFLVDEGAKVQWRFDPSLGTVKPTKKGGQTEVALVRQNFEPTKFPAFVPQRYRFPAIQLTSYGSWEEVVQLMAPLFTTARTPAANSPLLAMADDIAKANATPEAKLLAALRLAQEKVRYVNLALGESALIPATADETWSRRFGDCKGKTALLLALLDRLGIQAEPFLTNTETSALLGERLPTLEAFNHVVVRAHINGRTYLVDPTAFGQRTIEDLQQPGYEWGLPLVTGAQMWKVPAGPLPRPQTESDIVWDASKGFDQQVPFTATLTYRGNMAALLRSLQAVMPDRAALEKSLKDELPAIDSEHLTVTAIEPDQPQGEFVVRFSGKAPMPWTREIAGRQFRFDHSVPAWSVDFERADGQFKDLPVLLGAAAWTKSSETVILPRNGTGFSVKGAPIGSTIAGVEIKRTLKLEGGRATVSGEFRHSVPEISAVDARAAGPALTRIGKDYAYAVAPKDYVLSQAEVKAIVSEEADGYDAYVRRARLLMDQSDRRRALTELDKAAAIDSARPEAPALKSINYFYLDRIEEARKALAQALAIETDEADVLRAQALVAWYDRDAATALKSVNRAIELAPDFHGLFAIRARIRAGSGDYDEALLDVRHAIELSADTISPGMIAQFEAASGRFDQAIATIDKAIASGRRDDPYLFVLKGDLLLLQGKPTEAKTAYRLAKDEMRAEMDRRFKAETGGVPASSDIELQLLIMSRNYDEAEPLADRKIANQRYPSAGNLGRRAMVRVMNGKYEGAIADARNALGLDPSDEAARHALVLASLRTGKFTEAESLTTKALAKDPASANLYYARAVARARLGNTSGASEDLKSARQLRFDISLDPAFLGLKAD